jgi:O-antigen ligase
MTPVRRRDLGILAAGLAVASWLLVRAFYGHLPPLDWWLPVPLAVLAVAEALGARTLRARLAVLREARRARVRPGGKPPTQPVRPVEPMLVARLAVLAQASSYVGAVFTGIWIGVLVHVAPAVRRLQAAGPDTVTASLGVVASAALIAAALWLESVCRVPPEEDGPTEGASA